MHRRLILLRHAQTAGKQAGQRDYDRTLTPEGELQSRKTGQYFVLNSLTPDLLLSSSAVRARHTASLVAEVLKMNMKSIQLENELYEAHGATWMAFIRHLPQHLRTVICVGHNPAISGLAGQLSHRTIDLAPAGFVGYEVKAESWNDFDREISELATLPHSS